MSKINTETKLKNQLKDMLRSVRNLIDENINILTSARSLTYTLQNITSYLEELYHKISDICDKASSIQLGLDIECADLPAELEKTSSSFRKLGASPIEQLLDPVEINNVLNQLGQVITKVTGFVFTTVPNLLSIKAFQPGVIRTKEYIDKLLNKIRDDTLDNLKRDYSDLKSYADMLNQAMIQTMTAGAVKLDELFIAERLWALTFRGLWAQDILNELTGIRGVHAEISADEVEFCYEGACDPDKIKRFSIDDLLTRYPPYEPIAEKIQIGNAKISGSHIWLVGGKNVDICDKSFKCSPLTQSSKLIQQSIVKAKPIPGGIKIEGVVAKSLLEGPLILRIKSPGSLDVWVKYGSERLNALVVRGNSNEKIQQIYENDMAKYKRTRVYMATDLAYSWYCVLGLGISTDPWDAVCPFTDCSIGKEYRKNSKNNVCPKWSRSRKIFPKVFSIVEYKLRKPEGKMPLEVMQKLRYGVLTPVVGRGVYIDVIYKGVQWSMPLPYASIYGGRRVRIFFDRNIIDSLPRTNVVGIAMKLSLVKGFIHEILDPDVRPKPTIKSLKERNVGQAPTLYLDNLLKSKFFLWKRSYGGSTLFELLEKRDPVKSFQEFLKRLRGNDMEDIVDFSTRVLAHTLAHMLHTFLCARLGLRPNDLFYFYIEDRDEDLLYILIAENSPLGALNIVDHVESVFGSFDAMVKEFIRELGVLKKHLEDMSNSISHEAKELGKRFQDPNLKGLKDLADEINNYYDELLRNGLVLDEHCYLMHLLLSNKLNELTKKFGVDPGEAKDRLASLFTYSRVPYCLDGCTSCVMYERGCRDQTIQNLVLSRELLMAFLDTFFNREDFHARGDRFLSSLLAGLVKGELFIVSPFIDDKGVDLLEGLMKRGVRVVLVTGKGGLDVIVKKLGEALKDLLTKGLLELYIPKVQRHDKLYLIDNEVLIITSRNLTLASQSIESFSVRVINREEAENLKSQVRDSSQRWPLKIEN